MSKSLRILLVEDNEDDALLVQREIKRGGFDITCRRVETPKGMEEALRESWDLVISDYVMPQFNGFAALQMARQLDLDLPFIIVSGQIGEETAVSAMKAGAHDYVMKDRLARLVPAVERELREAEVRRARRKADIALRENEERFRQLAENIDLAFVMTEQPSEQSIGQVSYVSPAYEKIFGRSCDSVRQNALSWVEAIHPEDQTRIREAIPEIARGEFNQQFRILRPDQSHRWIHYRVFPVRNEQGGVYRIAAIAEDITDRRRAQEQLEANARELQRTVEELKLAEEGLRASNEQLRQAREELERRVEERTADLKIANAELQRQMIERRRLENELLEITERERQRIGIDLHDELGQHLNGIALMLKGLELKLSNKSLPESADAGKIQALVFKTINQAKAVARGLAQADLQAEDLPSALRELASQAKNLFPITCDLKIEGDIPGMPDNSVKQVYKIAQEAVTNAVKHAKAKEVKICLRRDREQLVLTIQNDGLGFPTQRFQNSGMGLKIMQYRASVIGGNFKVEPVAEAKEGTVVTCTFPVVCQQVAERMVSHRNGEPSVAL